MYVRVGVGVGEWGRGRLYYPPNPIFLLKCNSNGCWIFDKIVHHICFPHLHLNYLPYTFKYFSIVSTTTKLKMIRSGDQLI